MPGMPVGDLVPEIALLAGAGVVLVAALLLPRPRQHLGAVLALAAIAAAGLALAARAGGLPQLTFSGTYALDPAATAATAIVLALSALAVVATPEWLAGDARHGEYYALLALSALGAVLLAGASDLLVLLVAVLLSSVTGYTLAAYHRASPMSVEAGMKYFLVGALTNALLFVGVVLLFGATGTTRYAATAAAAAAGEPPLALPVGVALVVVGLGFKAGLVPAHSWLPDVAEGAPAPAAAFITTVPKVGALVAIARLVTLLPAEGVGWRPLVAVMAAATMTLGNLAALRQDDLRRLLGWSAVSQSGYALLGVVALGRSDLALSGLLTFLLAYGAANVAAFAVVTELRGRTALTDYRGLGRRRPVLGVVLAVSLLSFVGIPPTAGFVGKLALFGAAIDAGYAWLAALAVANTVVSLAYYLRVLGPAYLEPVPPGTAPLPVLGRWAAAAAVAGAVLVVAAGVAAEPILRLGGHALLPPPG